MSPFWKTSVSLARVLGQRPGAAARGLGIWLILLVTARVPAGTIEALVDISGRATGIVTLPHAVQTNFSNNESDTATESSRSMDRDLVFLSWEIGDEVKPVDFVFQVNDSSGVTEYLFFKTLANHTVRSWDGIRYALGFGVGDDFVPGNPKGGLDFDCPDLAPGEACPEKPNHEFNSLPYTTVRQTPTETVWSDGVVPIGWSTQSLFAMDVPDQSPSIPDPFRTSGGYQFTLRFQTAPEPNTLWVMGFMGSMVACRRRRWT